MAHRIFLSAALSLALTAGISAPLMAAQDAPGSAQDVEIGKHTFIGVINGTNVLVKSSPREDAYAVLKLDKGAKVTVVGIKFKWLKILPPEGSFAYVPKAYVLQRGSGKMGRATREVIAKVGSSLNQLKTAPMSKVDEGQDVEILGDQDEYWKIKPPEGSFLYVNESYVDPLKVIPTPAEKKAQENIAVTPPPAEKPRTPATPGHPAKPVTALNESGTDPLKTETPLPGAVAVVPPAPTTQPSEATATAIATFGKLEADFKAANELPITEQPIDSLMTGYLDVLKQDSLPNHVRKISEVRVSTLKLRTEAKLEFVANREAQQKAAEREKAIVAERQEIKERIKQNEVILYTAVGTLRASSIQRGPVMLYRLTDPATGRTVAYIRTNDTKYASFIGQFIGVKGTITTDEALNMKVIDQPKNAVAVDPAKLNSSVTAQIVPASLMPGVRSASAGG